MRSPFTHSPLRSNARSFTALFIMGLSACGPVTLEDAGPVIDDDAGSPVLTPGYVSSGDASGPRFTLDVTLDGGRTATVRVRGHELGTVFGYAFHVVTGALSLPARDALVLEPALGGALEATYAARVDDDVAVGAARNTRDVGAALADGGELLRFTVTSDVDGAFPLDITRAFVRRADGDVVIPRIERGVLTLTGDTP